MNDAFDYDAAFSRTIGWLTEQELASLRTKRVAIAGLGGVGGAYLLTLTRLGVGRFSVADPDIFELVNFNRQFGATLSSIGRPKVDVMVELALDINPELEIRRLHGGIDSTNLDGFLEGVDLYLDGLDFFVMDARQEVFAECARRGIPAVTAAPLGWGVSMLAFQPDGMSFEDYFAMQGCTEDEKLRRFLLGLSPERIQLGALVDRSRLDIEQRRGPSTIVGTTLCAATAGAAAVKILIGRGPVDWVPNSLHFDAFSNQLVSVSRPGGMNHPQMQSALAAMD